MSANIFQIWDSLGRTTPFAVRRDNWSTQFYTIVERVECEKMPYGKAFGFSVSNGCYSDHYDYNTKWRQTGLIPCCGCYQWTLVKDADLTIQSQTKGSKGLDERIKSLSSVLRFGKFNARTVAQAFEEQPSYIAWLIENVEPFVVDVETINALERKGYKFPVVVKELNQRKLGSLDA